MGYPQYPTQPAQYPAYGYPAPVGQTAPPMAQPMAPGADPFIDPSGGGVNAPLARHLVGRTIIVEPIRIDENAQFQGTRKPVAWVNLTVVDGGPIMYGDSLDRSKPPTPATHRIDTPCQFRNAMMPNEQLVNAIRSAVGMGILVGVIEQGTQGNRPYLLTKVDKDQVGNDRPDGAARRQRAADLWAQIQAGQFVNPQPTLLHPVQAANAYNAAPYGGQTPQWPNQYAPQPAAPQFTQPVYQQPAPGQPGSPQNPHQPQPVPPAPPQPQPAPIGDINTAPQGWDQSVWQNLTEQQRQQIIGSYQMAAGPAPAGGPGI